MTRAELIAALEAATEGSAVLDIRIARAIKWVNWEGCAVQQMPSRSRREAIDRFADRMGVPRYTRSVDDAFTLIPDGSSWNLGKWHNTVDGQVFWADVSNDSSRESARNKSAPLAICIAALKARPDGQGDRMPAVGT